MIDLLERLQAALADRYPVESEIGRGGMAVVFKALRRRTTTVTPATDQTTQVYWTHRSYRGSFRDADPTQ
jgi:hypothetical protein